jgi:hypothetical protein
MRRFTNLYEWLQAGAVREHTNLYAARQQGVSPTSDAGLIASFPARQNSVHTMKQVLLAIILIAVPVALFSGYEVYAAKTAPASQAVLGDLSSFKKIITDVQALVDSGDMVGASKRITDWESSWDQAETAIRPLNQTEWGHIDQASDGALSAVRASSPKPDDVKAALATLMAELADPTRAP